LLPAAGIVLASALVVACVVGPAAGLAADRRASAALADGRRALAGAVFGLFDGAAELLAFGRYRLRRNEIARLDASLAATARRSAFGAGVASAIATAALGIAAVGSIWFAWADRLNPVLAAVLALLALALAETVDGLAPALGHLDPLHAAYGRVTALSAAPPFTSGVVSGVDGGIVLDHVTVRWPGARSPALREVSLRVAPGATVAVCGPSGAGKSTLLALLLGFLPPEHGTAIVPARVAWCPADPHLVATTVRENLRLGDPAASDDRLRAALRAVALDDWRLDTVVCATTASGGEAKRIALARALLCDADLVLLDEPTAHLDHDTARRVLAGCREWLAGKTVVHVTHRPDDVADVSIAVDVLAGRVSVLSSVDA
jgi:ATP-binding cassette subfamily C protein CydCD